MKGNRQELLTSLFTSGETHNGSNPARLSLSKDLDYIFKTVAAINDTYSPEIVLNEKLMLGAFGLDKAMTDKLLYSYWSATGGKKTLLRIRISNYWLRVSLVVALLLSPKHSLVLFDALPHWISIFKGAVMIFASISAFSSEYEDIMVALDCLIDVGEAFQSKYFNNILAKTRLATKLGIDFRTMLAIFDAVIAAANGNDNGAALDRISHALFGDNNEEQAEPASTQWVWHRLMIDLPSTAAASVIGTAEAPAESSSSSDSNDDEPTGSGSRSARPFLANALQLVSLFRNNVNVVIIVATIMIVLSILAVWLFSRTVWRVVAGIWIWLSGSAYSAVAPNVSTSLSEDGGDDTTATSFVDLLSSFITDDTFMTHIAIALISLILISLIVLIVLRHFRRMRRGDSSKKTKTTFTDGSDDEGEWPSHSCCASTASSYSIDCGGGDAPNNDDDEDDLHNSIDTAALK